jgi:3-hydroxybenzoate 6-monooxygenase
MEPIVIAGAGIGGLSAAIALVRHGFSVRVYERAAQLREFGAGIQLGPNAARMFKRLGVQDAMEEIAFQPRAIVMMDSITGSEICRQALNESFQRRFGYPYRVGHRADVQKVLLQAARDYPDSLELRLGESVRSFAQTEHDVTVTLESGATSIASALIGADGLWSVVRQAILGDGQPRVSGHIAYRAVLSATEVPGDLLGDDVEVWVGPRHHLVCYKVSGGKSLNIVAIFHSSRYLEGWDTSGDAAELNAGFADACPRVRRLLSFVQTWRMWVLCDRDPMRGWSRGRVTLLGDAAHPTLPYLAQGACMALEDAVSLADRIARQSDNLPAALSEYERVRLDRTASVQQTAREMGEIYHADGQAREARNKALAARDPDDHEANAWLFGTDGPRDTTSTASFFGRVR